MARTPSSKGRLRIALFLAVGLAATGLALVNYGVHVWARGSGWDIFGGADLSSIDSRFSIRGEEKPPTNIVVVKVDGPTFSTLHERWPFRRSLHARLIQRLKKAGAKVIAFDIQFSEPTPNPPGSDAGARQDNEFLLASRAAGNVVFSTTDLNRKGEPNFLGGEAGIRFTRSRVGNGNFEPDPGGVDRRVPYEVVGLKSFSVVTVERATGHAVHPFSGARNLIDFVGPVGTIPSISYSDAYLGKFPKGYFRGKIVVVGAWAPSLQDIHPISFGNDEMPGPEIQASAISTILRGLPLQTVPNWLNVLLIVVLGVLAPLASLRLSLLWTLVVALTAAALYLGAALIAFDQGWVLSFVYPFGALTLSSIGSLAAHYLLAAFERERVRDVFSRFVPESVVEQVLARTDDDLRLGGVSLFGTVMFTDLRGFTTFSESLPAARVIEALNIYLSEMTEAILDNGGTLVSYEGDGIMAVFGAPIEQANHADQAVATSREMLLVRLPRWNTWLREHELSKGFKMGIGLMSGSFMSGNVGSERRLEYTAIGDTTNTASRLQGLTKGEPYLMFMADSTRESLTAEVEDIVFVEEFEVRGRQGKVKIWSIEAANSEAFDAREAEAAAAEGAAETG
ncbi:MAG TPA: adenylate/guanylate cyclase domain-containing protein [Gaiellaceae bacterium]|nr:adenylate/guanylate cyclase domain-containing protein [Gaiellaceae bacterium]